MSECHLNTHKKPHCLWSRVFLEFISGEFLEWFYIQAVSYFCLQNGSKGIVLFNHYRTQTYAGKFLGPSDPDLGPGKRMVCIPRSYDPWCYADSPHRHLHSSDHSVHTHQRQSNRRWRGCNTGIL